MKNLIVISCIAILFCLAAAIIFLVIGTALSFIFPAIPAFHAALLLMAPFCMLLLLIPLLLINQKMDQMMVMADEDYMFFDDEDFEQKRARSEDKGHRVKGKQNKIIVMDSSPIIDKNASCPCGSGEKFKNCCGGKGKST